MQSENKMFIYLFIYLFSYANCFQQAKEKYAKQNNTQLKYNEKIKITETQKGSANCYWCWKEERGKAEKKKTRGNPRTIRKPCKPKGFAEEENVLTNGKGEKIK